MEISKLDLSELLDNEDVIVDVLNDALKSNDSTILLRTIGYIAKARGISQISEITGLGRESLYKALNENAHPRFDTVMRVINAMGFQLVLKVPQKKKPVVHSVAEKRAKYSAKM